MIFITGCNGLVGSFIARKLIHQGEKIVALKRKNSDLSLIKDIESFIEWFEGDIADTEMVNEAMKQCDTVIHAAAIISFAPRNRDKMYQVNVEGTANIVNASLHNNIKRFCYISSIAALGRKKGEFTINENALWEDSEMNTHYAKSKYLGELEVWRGIEEGLPAFIVNPSVILGPGNWHNGSTKIFNYVFKKNKFYTNGCINYVDVSDVASIIVELLNKNIFGERYILNAGRVSYKELFSTIASSFKIKEPNLEVKKNLAEFFWRIERIRTLFSNSEPILTKETVKLSGFSFEYQNEKIRELLGYEFSSLQSTSDRTCKELVAKYVNK
ncbi:MAG TPA: SDR family NAD(P)-dependent oxidoreductase [Cytophagaceae bacterium]|jgi:dihydroflavonol-4-reductase|nr:SDR family NAD(P)-dependent oxidoreductase [Cytophagaceae bacterium]